MKPWHMGTHLRVRNLYNMTVFIGLLKNIIVNLHAAGSLFGCYKFILKKNATETLAHGYSFEST